MLNPNGPISDHFQHFSFNASRAVRRAMQWHHLGPILITWGRLRMISGILCRAHLGSLQTIWGPFVAHVLSWNCWLSAKCAPRGITPEINSPIWGPPGGPKSSNLLSWNTLKRIPEIASPKWPNEVHFLCYRLAQSVWGVLKIEVLSILIYVRKQSPVGIHFGYHFWT